MRIGHGEHRPRDYRSRSKPISYLLSAITLLERACSVKRAVLVIADTLAETSTRYAHSPPKPREFSDARRRTRGGAGEAVGEPPVRPVVDPLSKDLRL